MPLKGVEDAILEGKDLFSKKDFNISNKNLNLNQRLKLNIKRKCLSLVQILVWGRI